jgi:hypothetical protein
MCEFRNDSWQRNLML